MSEPRSAASCAIARSLEVVGQKWSLLVVHEAMLGTTRFADFRARLGVAPDVLTDRLSRLVEQGVLERRAYREPGERERAEYLLTPAGRDLMPLLTAMLQWGDAHRPVEGPTVGVTVEKAARTPVRLAYLDSDGHELTVDQVALVRRPVESDVR